MNANLNSVSRSRLANIISFAWFNPAPSRKALKALPTKTDELRVYLDYVIRTVECLAPEMFVLIDAVTRNAAKYDSYIRGMAERALIVHAASNPKLN